MEVLAHRCSYPRQGAAVEILSKQHERLGWTGTVRAANGRPVEPIGCNYNVRSGTVRFTTPAL